MMAPYTYAGIAAELGAMRTEVGVPQALHADETAEHLCQALQKMTSPSFMLSLDLKPVPEVPHLLKSFS